jgi:hypothetical protein
MARSPSGIDKRMSEGKSLQLVKALGAGCRLNLKTGVLSLLSLKEI